MDSYCLPFLIGTGVGLFYSCISNVKEIRALKEKAEMAEFKLSMKEMDSRTDVQLATMNVSMQFHNDIFRLNRKIAELESQKCNCKGEKSEQI